MKHNEFPMKSSSQLPTDFRESVTSIIDKFKRARQTRFANSNHCDITSIHVHNDKPIAYLVKQFKDSNSIKSRVYKSLTPDQQSAWLSYYDSNKQLRMMTEDQHRQFHDTHKFDVKSGTFIESFIDNSIKPNNLDNDSNDNTNESIPSRQSSRSIKSNKSSNNLDIDHNNTNESISSQSIKQNKRKINSKNNLNNDSNDTTIESIPSQQSSQPIITQTTPVTTTNTVKTKVGRVKKTHK